MIIIMSLRNLFGIRKNKEDPEVTAIMNEISDLKKLIDTARINYNNVTDSDSIDYYTYILKAYQVRYDKLIKQLKCHDYFNGPTPQIRIKEEKPS